MAKLTALFRSQIFKNYIFLESHSWKDGIIKKNGPLISSVAQNSVRNEDFCIFSRSQSYTLENVQ